MLCKLSHPNVLKCRGITFNNGGLCYLAEYIEGGQLADILKNRVPECLTWTTLLNVAMEVARGMAYIHSQGIIHRDLNTSNIFVRRLPDGRLQSIIGDLGLSCQCPADDA